MLHEDTGPSATYQIPGMCDMGEWAEEAREVERNAGELCRVHKEEGDTSVRLLHTFSSMRAGTMPKKGLIAMPGRISAPSSEGRGAMQMPPVSMGEDGEQTSMGLGVMSSRVWDSHMTGALPEWEVGGTAHLGQGNGPQCHKDFCLRQR